MLEPPTPAGEPFGTLQEEENKTSTDFESVCISLVERGWKIMPKKGTYPINKKGPRYVNLVDPRGNRKSIRVIDESLWEKLRAAETRRTSKKEDDQETPKHAESQPIQDVEAKETAVEESGFETAQVAVITAMSEAIAQTALHINQQIAEAPVETIVENIAPDPEPAISMEKPIIETSASTVAEEPVILPTLPELSEMKAAIVENPPKELESFALSSPGLQKSIFDLGFETLLNVLQSAAMNPAEIVSKMQEWSTESKNLLEFVHKSQERTQPRSPLPDSSEKDELISELQSTLRETEDKLSEILKSSQEI